MHSIVTSQFTPLLSSPTPRPLASSSLPPRPLSLFFRTPLPSPQRRLLCRAADEGLVKEPIEVELAGGGGGEGGRGSSGGGGDREDNGGGSEGDEQKKKMSGFSMSQKLTLAYAALVGVGGAIGYLKSGSQKSLIAGGSSALLLFFVHTQLPVHPVFASSVGLGLSAALLAVMGSRFKRSGKIFPAGVVAVVSFIMTGGYFHGIIRSLHA